MLLKMPGGMLPVNWQLATSDQKEKEVMRTEKPSVDYFHKSHSPKTSVSAFTNALRSGMDPLTCVLAGDESNDDG